MLSATPDQVIVHAIECCQHCQWALREVENLQVERRQVLDLPSQCVVVIEYQAQQKYCPHCQQISKAPFPQDVLAPGKSGAVGVYLVRTSVVAV